MHCLSILLPLVAASYASAHGFVSTLRIGDKSFNGNIPGGVKAPTPIRQISSSFPNHGADNVDITCGPKSIAGDLIADANPGDEVHFDWKGGDLGFWPHNIGPVLNYMASCGNITCDQFNITQAKWFKIDQAGKKTNSGNVWFQNDIMQGDLASTRIPSTLAPGNYIIRHEIIALHLANTGPGKAEFYPSCSQLRIGGNGTGVPQATDLVNIPGAYKDSDPGLFVKDLFNDPNAEYIFPGPPIAKLVSSNGATLTVSSITTSTAATTPTSSAASGPCASSSLKMKKRFISHSPQTSL